MTNNLFFDRIALIKERQNALEQKKKEEKVKEERERKARIIKFVNEMYDSEFEKEEIQNRLSEKEMQKCIDDYHELMASQNDDTVKRWEDYWFYDVVVRMVKKTDNYDNLSEAEQKKLTYKNCRCALEQFGSTVKAFHKMLKKKQSEQRLKASKFQQYVSENVEFEYSFKQCNEEFVVVEKEEYRNNIEEMVIKPFTEAGKKVKVYVPVEPTSTAAIIEYEVVKRFLAAGLLPFEDELKLDEFYQEFNTIRNVKLYKLLQNRKVRKDDIGRFDPSTFSFPLNLNTASEQDIARVPGLHAKIAKRIIKERKKGRFLKVEHLSYVPYFPKSKLKEMDKYFVV